MGIALRHSPSQSFEERINDWIVPILLAAMLALLSWMALTLQSLSQTLAVSVFRLDSMVTVEREHHDDHERRIETLETARLRESKN